MKNESIINRHECSFDESEVIWKCFLFKAPGNGLTISCMIQILRNRQIVDASDLRWTFQLSQRMYAYEIFIACSRFLIVSVLFKWFLGDDRGRQWRFRPLHCYRSKMYKRRERFNNNDDNGKQKEVFEGVVANISVYCYFSGKSCPQCFPCITSDFRSFRDGFRENISSWHWQWILNLKKLIKSREKLYKKGSEDFYQSLHYLYH